MTKLRTVGVLLVLGLGSWTLLSRRGANAPAPPTAPATPSGLRALGVNSATPSQGDRATDAAASKTLLGSWKYVERELGKIRVRIRFEPDGRAQIDNFRVDGSLEDSSSGTYRILGNKLSIVLHDAAAPNAAVIMTKSYYAGAKKLLMGA